MKFVAILSLALVLGLVQADCMKYVCDPKDTKWTAGVCGMPDPTVPNQYDVNTSTCSSKQLCVQGATDAVCTDPDQNPTYGYPGEKCSSSYPCKNNVSCVSDKCQSKNAGDECTNAYDCGVNLTCAPAGAKVNTCVALAEVGGVCYQNSDCVQNAGCAGGVVGAAPVEGVCTKFYSIAPQATAAADCAAVEGDFQASSFCQSGYCFQSAGKFACSDVLASTGPTPVACTVPSTCTSANDSVAKAGIQGNCACGLSGNSYCPLFPGDSDWTSYMSYLTSFLGSSHLMECNSFRMSASAPNYADWCWKEMYSPSDKALYAYYKVQSYQTIINADKCVVKTLYKWVTDAEDASNWLLLSGLALALLN